MASLDNFQTPQGSIVRPNHPSYADRMRMIQLGVQSSRANMWDVPNHVPLAPVQPHDPANRAPNAHVDPLYVERMSTRAMKDHLVALEPHTQRKLGDTADGMLLYQKPFGLGGKLKNMWSRFRAPVQTHNRYHPYEQGSNRSKPFHIALF